MRLTFSVDLRPIFSGLLSRLSGNGQMRNQLPQAGRGRAGTTRWPSRASMGARKFGKFELWPERISLVKKVLHRPVELAVLITHVDYYLEDGSNPTTETLLIAGLTCPQPRLEC